MATLNSLVTPQHGELGFLAPAEVSTTELNAVAAGVHTMATNAPRGADRLVPTLRLVGKRPNLVSDGGNRRSSLDRCARLSRLSVAVAILGYSSR